MSKQPDSEPDLGAPAIEIGIELAAPKQNSECLLCFDSKGPEQRQ
jgi:hypothetical protein